MKLQVKSGVCFHSDSFGDCSVMRIVRVVCQEAPEGYSPTVTSGCDGVHSTNSSHYVGKGFDFRTRDLDPATVQVWAKRIKGALGDYYFVLVESDHIHIQFNG